MSWIFLLPVIAIVLGTIIKAFGTTPSQSLNNKFISLGTISGKTYNEIITVVGEPNSKSYVGGTYVCQWIQPAYHIVLLFDKNMICLGIQSETKIDEL
nr:MAG TPA: hypothetical protein [Bacteriophage sp.]